MRTKTALVNDTPFQIAFLEGYAGIYRLNVQHIPAGGKYTVLHDDNATYKEYRLRFDVELSNPGNLLVLSSDDVGEFNEIRVVYRVEDNEVSFVTPSSEGEFPSPSDQPASQLDIALKTVKNMVSPKFDAASRSCSGLKRSLIGVKICQKQCNHLVQTCVEGMEKMTGLYSLAVKGTFMIWRLYNTGRVNELYNHLDRLEDILCDAKDLLEGCRTDLGTVALVVSMPMPVEKDMEASSMFDLLLGELMWTFDVIEHVLLPAGSVKLEWSPALRRCSLKRSTNVEIAQANSGETRPATYQGVHGLARADRKDLQLGLENGSIFIPDTRGPTGWRARLWSKPNNEILQGIIIERCKVEMRSDQNPESMDCRSLSVDPVEVFKISHLDLEPDPKKLLGEGAFKRTYEGKWCGQRVAIATLKDFEFEDLRKEVEQLLGLQHPKVLSFFGWAYTDDAPEPIKKPEDVAECKGGYIVTELMECDLEYLINTTQKTATVQKDSGGPFSHSVGLDILLQIVEAMLHMHKHGVMHRDLKPANFLVKSRSSRGPGADKYYDVKLIDFGSSKLLGEDKNTYNKGTSRFGAPEMMVGPNHGGEVKGEYDRAIDVFSFALTCYQVITGIEPFRKSSSKAAREMIQRGERPEIPATVLIGFKELMEACWAQNPESRPTFEGIQERLWTIKKDLAVPVK